MSEARPIECAAPVDEVERPLPGTRAWFVLFVLWMTSLAALALICHPLAEAGEQWALRVWLLALMVFYLSLCNAFLPLPTAWVVLLAGLPQYAVVETPWLRIPLSAALLTSATVVANLNEYHLLSYLLRFGLGKRIRRARLYGRAARLFERSPFELLALVAFVPIPVDAVRWLAILGRYARVRFALAYFTGRGLRYALLLGCALAFELSGRELTPRQILILQVALVAVALGLRGLRAVMKRGAAAPVGAGPLGALPR